MPAISNHDALTTGCCIAGGGPAGMMLGFLLARAGVEVVVLEKHPDFLRDFRGDTIHPSTLRVGLVDFAADAGTNCSTSPSLQALLTPDAERLKEE